jgi:hypothetical protein
LRFYGTGTLTLADALDLAEKAMYFYGGITLVTNNNDITCGIFGDLSTIGNVTLTLGSSTVNCTNVSFNSATLTVTTNTATVSITTKSNIYCYLGTSVNWSGTSFNVTCSASGSNFRLGNTGNTVANFHISWASYTSYSNYLGIPTLFTVTGTFTFDGGSTIRRPLIQALNAGRATISAGTVSITGTVDFFAIIGAGAGSWDLSGINSGNRGGNSGITFRTPATYYMVGVTDNKNLYSDIWSTTDDGTPDGTTVFPLPQDTIIVNNNTGDNTNKVVTFDSSSWIGNIDTSALTESLTFQLNSCNFCGDIDFTGSGLTITSSATYTQIFNCLLKSDSSDTMDINVGGSFGIGNHCSVTNVYNVTCPGVKLLSALTITGTFTLARSTFDVNGNTLTCGVFSSSNTNTRELKDSLGGGKIVLTELTGTIFDMSTATNLAVNNAPGINIGNSALTQTGDVTFAGGGKSFGDFTVKKHAGNYSCLVTGANTFGVITLETPNATYQYSHLKLPAGITTTCSGFVSVGTASYNCELESNNSNQHTLSDSGGTNTVSYTKIKNSAATGGAIWQAFISSGNTDDGNNSGWDFFLTTPAPTTTLPTTLAPTTLAPTTIVPTTIASTTLAPTTIAPTTLAPTTIAPTTELPTTFAPTTEAPTTLIPTTLAVTTQAPTTLAPTTLEPTTLVPTSLAPTTLAATTELPTTVSPTTQAPTTVAPTTLASTTIIPSTLAPTTLAPTTVSPTTTTPTTLPVTTLAPTTILVTTLSPTTTVPTTLGPTTLPPTTLVPTTVVPMICVKEIDSYISNEFIMKSYIASRMLLDSYITEEMRFHGNLC